MRQMTPEQRADAIARIMAVVEAKRAEDDYDYPCVQDKQAAFYLDVKQDVTDDKNGSRSNQADEHVRDCLSEDNINRPQRRHHNLLHRPAFFLAHHGH